MAHCKQQPVASAPQPQAPSQADQREAVAEAAAAFRMGQMVLVTDGAHRDRGGVVAVAADRASDDVVNFMATHARGIVSLALLKTQVERLGLGLQAESPLEPEREAYTVSIEARDGTTTGISAADRALTIRVAADPQSRPDSVVTPGHIFPVLADTRGVFFRHGWAEASVDLARIAGLQPAAAFCQILDTTGEVAMDEALDAFAGTHIIPAVDIAELAAHRMRTESCVSLLTQAMVPTPHGQFLCRVFRDTLTGGQHLALSMGAVRTADPVLVRMHSECLTGDVLGSRRCDCGLQLSEAMRRIATLGRGVILYLRQEGRGIGLVSKTQAYALQDQGRDTVEANLELGFEPDLRNFAVGAQMLLAIGVHRVHLLTNNPRKIADLERGGIEVTDRETLEVAPNAHSHRYLSTKKSKLGHLLTRV